MKVLLTGLPLFTERLHKALSEFDKQNTYYRLDTYYNKKDRLKALALLPFIDIVYSINGTVEKSKVFDLAFSLGKNVVMNWVGTDVVKALECKSPNLKYIEKSTHLCEVNWIKEELSEIGINAEVLNFASFDKQFEPVNSEAEKLTVLNYIPGNRANFYGIESYINLAKKFPEINFLIAGASQNELTNLPSNIEALGWVKDMDAVFNQAHICMRFPEHDGLSNFILESLARGKQVLYKYNYKHCLHSPTIDDLINHLKKLQSDFNCGKSLINSEGKSFIESNFNSQIILSQLVSKLKEVNAE